MQFLYVLLPIKTCPIHRFYRVNYYMEKAEAGLMISTILRYGFGKKCQCLILLNPWMYLQLRSEPKLCFMAEIWVQGINHEGTVCAAL